MELLASDKKLTAITVEGGPEIKRGKRGTFTVDDRTGKAMLRSGEWGRVGMSMRDAPGYRCACGHLSVFKDRCGRCGATDLEPEED